MCFASKTYDLKSEQFIVTNFNLKHIINEKDSKGFSKSDAKIMKMKFHVRLTLKKENQIKNMKKKRNRKTQKI